MKKFRLIASVLLMTAGLTASATTTIGNGAVTLDPNDATIEGKVKEVDGVNTYDSFKNGKKATFTINNTTEQLYTISFKAATQLDGTSLTFVLTDNATGAEEINKTVDVTNNGTWGSVQDDFLPYSFNTDKAITTGEKTLVVTFNGPKYTLNAELITFTPLDASITYYTITKIVTPDEAGTISAKPGYDSFEAGTEVTLTATAASWKYAFDSWAYTIGDGAEQTSTDAELTITMTANVTVTANFKEVDPYNTIPTTDENPFNLEKADFTIGYWENGSNIGYMNDGGTATYQVKATEDDAYIVSFQSATAADGASVQFTLFNADGTQIFDKTVDINNGGWSDYQDYSFEVDQFAAGDYILVLTFHAQEGSFSANVKNLKFTSKSSTGIESVETGSIMNGAAYSLDGVKLDISKAQKGVYILNGKKIVIR